MAWDQGLGNCLIPDANGEICGKQIAEGEAIGTIVLGGPKVGHKRCADAYHARVQLAEREKRLQMVKRIDQAGPGGPVDYNSERDAILGSIPLETKPGDPVKPAEAAVAYAQSVADNLGNLAAAAAAEGVKSVGSLPMDTNPVAMMTPPGEEAAPLPPGGIIIPPEAEDMEPDIDLDQLHQDLDMAKPSPAEEMADKWYQIHKGNGSTTTTTTTTGHVTMGQPKMAFASPPPDVRASNGMVTLSNVLLDDQGVLWLDPDDAESLAEMLAIQIKRAWRQRA